MAQQTAASPTPPASTTPARDRRSTDGLSASSANGTNASARLRPMTTAIFPMPVLPDDLRAQGVFVNLEGDYTYLGDGYYRSMEAEHEGMLAFPSPQAAIDAYVVPLALSKAQAAGIPIPEWEIVNDQASLTEAFKSLTMSNKYAVVCQAMQADARIDTLRLVLGKCLKPEYADLAEKLWRTFHIPLARVKVIVTETQYLFSAIQPLKKEELTQNEKSIIKEAGLWRA
jgi:hypothetical protein